MKKFVLVVCAVLFCSSAKAEMNLYEIEARTIQLTNEERAKNGLPPLTRCDNCIVAARNHSFRMARFRFFQHSNFRGGENIAMGQSDCREAVRGWMNSSGHRANILNRNYRWIGCSAFRSPGGTVYYTQCFR